MPLNDEEYSRSGGDTHMQEESGDDRTFEVDEAESSEDDDDEPKLLENEDNKMDVDE
jgi:hypothetical protein